MAAVYSGQVAAENISAEGKKAPDFTKFITLQKNKMLQYMQTKSKFPVTYILNSIASIMNEDLGITRCEETLLNGISQIDFFLDIIEKLRFDSRISPYQNYAIGNQLLLCKAILLCAENRKESRGSHIREDYPLLSPNYEAASIVTYEAGKFMYRLEKEKDDTLTLEPLSKFPVVADLIVDRRAIFDSLVESRLWIDEREPLNQVEYTHQYTAAKCLKCGICLEVCPNYRDGTRFFGAAIVNEAYLSCSQNRKNAHQKEMRKNYEKHFVAGCSKSLACERLCPAKMKTLSSICKLQRKV